MSDTTYISRFSRVGATWFWLAYMGFFFIEPILEPKRHLWLPSLAVAAAFVVVFAIYVRTGSGTVRRATVWISLLFGIFSFPWNGGASVFFIYAAAFCAYTVESLGWILSFFGLEVLILLAEYRWANPRISLPDMMIAIFLVVVVGAGNIFFAEQRRANCKLRMANEEIEAIAAVAERERIARDLHDVLGHTLSLIVLKSELAGRLIERDPQRATEEIADVERTARTALAEVREAIGGYRTRGLIAEIEAARRALDTAGVVLLTEITSADTTSLTAGEESVLSLALREAVTNIVRHAKAHHCRVRFVTQEGRRRLLVEDDGSHPLIREGNGLRGMRERVESVGGTLRVERDNGTRLLIELPISTPAVSGAAL